MWQNRFINIYETIKKEFSTKKRDLQSKGRINYTHAQTNCMLYAYIRNSYITFNSFHYKFIVYLLKYKISCYQLIIIKVFYSLNIFSRYVVETDVGSLINGNLIKYKISKIFNWIFLLGFFATIKILLSSLY